MLMSYARITFGWDPLLDHQGNRMTWTRRIAPKMA
jgi:hypothetical protein